jgi:hypothetical protein
MIDFASPRSHIRLDRLRETVKPQDLERGTRTNGDTKSLFG